MEDYNFWPKIVWKHALYAKSGALHSKLLDRLRRARELKCTQQKGCKDAEETGLTALYGSYCDYRGSATIFLSASETTTAVLKAETLLHEFLHHLATMFLPRFLEYFCDDLVDSLL